MMCSNEKTENHFQMKITQSENINYPFIPQFLRSYKGRNLHEKLDLSNRLKERSSR